MEQNKINLFLAQHGNKFPEANSFMLLEKMKTMSDDSFSAISMISFKNPTTWLLLYLFVPFLCFIDRIILGDVGLGILKLVTIGGFGIWVFVDIFTISSRVKQLNFKKLQPYLYS
ncbi:MAG: hypothetical protein A2W90_14585 [Bacteroidetes bacterium GWF2_42_66]|nr:MAG: hypothetical protein A2W92_15980 [Bacteroidetes bacterium GWA2_42_15]OFX99078.1 MAG: hypothetical protein A2W89_06675 [Bacteroidetes bacterium GWE2_42_39]OFY46753.1 MAG: hypothetical protein A2W90_14585 [Bacteroidetes bacterium GWF2_42_66]HAZ00700.1 hypothetical protein [Marinilabiliales bacterium]HBL73840.1 hypothetical protein [Prolixibacteraceae bacterium]